MTDLDLRGWTFHPGQLTCPVPLDTVVVPLFRGTPAHGPHEGGAVVANDLRWGHAPGEPAVQPDPMDVLMGKAPLLPASDIIAWRLPDTEATPYPHVRADIGA